MAKLTDRNAEQVHVFALQMGNLGLSRVADLLLSMFKSGAWRDFSDGIGRYKFLPGEFDYFLTQQGVTRELVIHGVRDIAVKAEIEEAMDERRTGEEGYRRRLEEIRQQIPERPGNPIEPFGYTKAEARYLLSGKEAQVPLRREALGRGPRQWRTSGGITTKRPSESLTRTERIARLLTRMSDEELSEVARAVTTEQQQRLATDQ